MILRECTSACLFKSVDPWDARDDFDAQGCDKTYWGDWDRKRVVIEQDDILVLDSEMKANCFGPSNKGFNGFEIFGVLGGCADMSRQRKPCPPAFFEEAAIPPKPVAFERKIQRADCSPP